MITYRAAKPSDYPAIAKIHAISWQQNYRGILDDHYLDHEVHDDRQQVWQERMDNPKVGQLVDVAVDGDQVVGFVCTFLDYDEHGTYLDNLHISHLHQGHGIGAELMSISTKRVVNLRPNTSLYLWVLAQNEGAKRFYERLGGQVTGPHHLDLPSGGGSADAYRVMWNDPTALIK